MPDLRRSAQLEASGSEEICGIPCDGGHDPHIEQRVDICRRPANNSPVLSPIVVHSQPRPMPPLAADQGDHGLVRRPAMGPHRGQMVAIIELSTGLLLAGRRQMSTRCSMCGSCPPSHGMPQISSRAAGFEPEPIGEGWAYRFRRGAGIVDILVPDHSVAEPIADCAARITLEALGGRQALNRARQVQVDAGDGVFEIPSLHSSARSSSRPALPKPARPARINTVAISPVARPGPRPNRETN